LPTKTVGKTIASEIYLETKFIYSKTSRYFKEKNINFFLYFLKIDNYDNDDGGFEH